MRTMAEEGANGHSKKAVVVLVNIFTGCVLYCL